LTPFITLTTDFGRADSYVAELHAEIFKRVPSARVFDIAHDVEQFQIGAAAVVLSQAIKRFPAGGIHVGVVDPGVGSSRRRIIIEAQVEGQSGTSFFVGPDNGLFDLVADEASCIAQWEITNTDLLGSAGTRSTFDGRDVFVPAAVHLFLGNKPESLGPALKHSELVRLSTGRFDLAAGVASIVAFDRFGTAITNIPATQELGSIRVKGFELPLVKNYAELRPGSVGCLKNSHGYWEIAVNQGSARELLGLRVGEEVKIQVASTS